MKRLLPLALGTAIFSLASSVTVFAEELPPGQVDFGVFTPPKGGGEFVEVNLPGSLISLAAKLVEKDEPDLGRLLNGLKLVRVNVIGVDDENRADLEKRLQKVRKELSGKGWERIVTAQQKGQDVGVYLKMSDKGGVQGLVAMVIDGDKEAVFVNVVGEIKPEQLALLGDKLHIDPLKSIASEKQEKKPAEKAPDKPRQKAED